MSCSIDPVPYTHACVRCGIDPVPYTHRRATVPVVCCVCLGGVLLQWNTQWWRVQVERPHPPVRYQEGTSGESVCVRVMLVESYDPFHFTLKSEMLHTVCMYIAHWCCVNCSVDCWLTFGGFSGFYFNERLYIAVNTVKSLPLPVYHNYAHWLISLMLIG